jgi:hypothetical protein
VARSIRQLERSEQRLTDAAGSNPSLQGVSTLELNWFAVRRSFALQGCADVRRRSNDIEIDRGINVGSTQCQAMLLKGGLDDPECLRSDAVQLRKLLTRSTCKLSQRRITSSIQCSRGRCADLRECVKR